MNTTITAVPGIAVGHWSDADAATGVTVVLLPEPNTTALDVRGLAPGTREAALLAPGKKVDTVQAICLAGGSAFGLAAADGVVAELESAGRGHWTPAGIVPIVPSAIIFDLAVGDSSVRPDGEAGAAAYRSATSDPVAEGSVGVGTGATVAKWRGLEHVRKSGVGSMATTVGAATVGVLVVTNAMGDVWTPDGVSLTGGDARSGPPGWEPPPATSTTLAVVATDAAVSRTDLELLMVRSHDAYAVALRPVHTRYDGDAVFASSCGTHDVDLDALGEAVFRLTAQAIERSVRMATSIAGVPTINDRDPS